MPPIYVERAISELAVVAVTASRPVIEHHSGKTIVNVENSVLAAGNSAMDILARAPGVTIDKDDNISLQGKAGVTVMIDGKLTYLSGEQLSSLLRSTDGSSIKAIELVPNPTANYDAAGTSGIINIRLKKSTKDGTNINLIAGAAYGTHAGNNTAVSFNHKAGKYNFYGNLSRADFAQDRFVQIKRSLDSASTRTYFNQDGKVFDSRHNNSFRVGIDYDLTPNNTIGIVIGGYTNPRRKINNSRTDVGAHPDVSDFFENTDADSRFSANNLSGNLNDRIKLDTSGAEINFDLNYSKFHNNTNASYHTVYYDPAGAQLGTPQVLINKTPSIIGIRAAKVDFTKPITKQLKLEAGAKFSSVKADNDLDAHVLSNGSFINDTTRSNHFLYDEKISAGYVALNDHLANTTINLGLRAEYTSSSGDLTTRESVVQKKYLNFFPNLLIEQAIGDKNDLSFSYSRRINRPDYQDLNPFIYYVDQFTYVKGNAFLQPEYSNNFQLTYAYDKTWNVGLAYQHTEQVISGVFLTDTLKKSTVITKSNLSHFKAYTLNINFPLHLTSWWSASADLNGIYEQTQASGLTGYLNRGKGTFQGKLSQQLKFCKVCTAEVMVNYSALEANGYDLIKPMFATDAGLSYSFLKKTANVKLAVSNVFNGSVYHILSSSQGSTIDTRLNVIPRTARLTISYSIGKSGVRRRQHGSEEEERRVNNG